MSLSKILKFVFVALVLFEVDDIFAQEKDSIIHFIFTSDVHFGLTKEHFRNQEDVAAVEVNKAMVQVMNQLPSIQLPKDNGVQQNKLVQGIDAVVITGDIANRMENGIQTAT